jgi:hypothetical protein
MAEAMTLRRRAMTRGRRILVLASALPAALLLRSAPAGAEPCQVTVEVAGKPVLTFTVNVPPGTPLSEIALPVKLPLAQVSESCTAPSTASPPTVTPTTTTSTTGGAAPPRPAPPSAQRPTVRRRASSGARSRGHRRVGSPGTTAGRTAVSPAPKPSATAGSAPPTTSNPTFSYALPGPAPIGVPNFFIDSFRIPPFLLPIYQAAGIEYDVPWQVLAAINEIETDYGRNLSVSSAGAVGWMQFLPSTWKQWGVDATGSGYADPYNPTDAIFTAARYLQAAGAARNLPRAIFAYNHAGWYVQSVLLRAQLIGGTPAPLIGALTDLTEGHFPVAAAATYADDGTNHVSIYAAPSAPVIAVNDGKILAVGRNFIKLQDATGNTYTYAHLGSVARFYAVPKAAAIASPGVGASAQTSTAPLTPATAGVQGGPSAVTSRPAAGTRTNVVPAAWVAAARLSAARAQAPAGVPKERLFAYPSRPASYAAGGSRQLHSSAEPITSVTGHLSDPLHLARGQYTLAPLRAGAIVVAGTTLGRLGSRSAGHLEFMIQPAGPHAPYIDPKPILDGWKLLEDTAIYRASGIDPFFGPRAKNPTIGQVLLMSEQQLQARVLSDPHVSIYRCGRRDIQSRLIDRRVLATIEFLVASGLDPTISGLACDSGINGSSGIDRVGTTGTSMDISRINGIPILHHQGPGSITDITIRTLLTLQGAMAPSEIVSRMAYKGQAATISLPDHANRIQVTFAPRYGQNHRLSNEIRSILQPDQWIKLIQRIGEITEPVVPVGPSRYATQDSHRN